MTIILFFLSEDVNDKNAEIKSMVSD